MQEDAIRLRVSDSYPVLYPNIPLIFLFIHLPLTGQCTFVIDSLGELSVSDQNMILV